MNLRHVLISALLSAPLAAFAASGCENIFGTPITERVLWPQVFAAMTNESNCTQNCHLGSAPSAGLDLSDSNFSVYFLVTQPSQQNPNQLLVDPGNPRASLLFQKLNCNSPDVGNRMPPGGQAPVSLQKLVYDWINQGAYGEGVEDPITRDFIFKNGVEGLRQ
jgi:hypothetical protein